MKWTEPHMLAPLRAQHNRLAHEGHEVGEFEHTVSIR